MEAITKQIQVTKVFRQTQEAQEPVIVNVGSARSSKSYSLCQFFLFQKLLKLKNYKLLILRKVRHSLKLSTYEMFLEILKDSERYSPDNHNKSDLIYHFPETGSVVRFSGMDDIAQIKSTEWTDIWMEEANEFSQMDYLFLKTRLSKGENVRIYMSLNPESCWVKGIEGKKGVKFIYSTYKDNPFLSEEYIRILEELKDQDEVYYQIYTLGKWGIIKNIIYTNWDTIPEMPNSYEELIWGLDFGFTHPTGLLEIRIKELDVYLREHIYQTHLTNPELIDLMKGKIIIKSQSLYADSEDPARIKEIHNAGFNVLPQSKGPGSVVSGINFCRRMKIHITEDSPNLKKEIEGYKHKVDKDGNALEDPVKFKDDLMDAMRGAIYTHLKRARGDIVNIGDISDVKGMKEPVSVDTDEEEKEEHLWY